MNSVIPAVIRQMPSLPNPPTDFVRDVISYGYFGDVSRYVFSYLLNLSYSSLVTDNKKLIVLIHPHCSYFLD